MSQLTFQADIERFAALTGGKIDEVLGAVAVALHGKLAERTPYRSGRARASWNIKEGDSADTSVAPELPGNLLDASMAEVLAARRYYDAIYEQKHAYVPSEINIRIDGKDVGGIDVITISNNLNYIELLNAGYSKQAPAAFFELTVGSMELFIESEIARFAKV